MWVFCPRRYSFPLDILIAVTFVVFSTIQRFECETTNIAFYHFRCNGTILAVIT